jgi:phospholipase C
MPVSRRDFLIGAGTAGALAAVGGVPAMQRAAAATDATTRRLPSPKNSGIEHVVVVCMENRSFDHFLGWVPGANGKQAGLSYRDPSGVLHTTHHLTDWQGCDFNDPSHSHKGGMLQLNGGRMNGFQRGTNDEYALGYYTKDDLPTSAALVSDFTICDNWFCGILGPTFPNRFYTHAGTTDRIENVLVESKLPTIWDRLHDAFLPAKYYYSDLPILALWGGKYQDRSFLIDQFFTDARNGTLPVYSYVDPLFIGESQGASNDDHPHADIRRGQSFIASIVNALLASPNWDSTVLLITYDEWGGFFEHVVPLALPDTPRAVRFSPAYQDPTLVQTGFRVPMYLVSPFAAAGAVRHRPFDHTSILRLVEWRWNLAPVSWRDATALNPATMLDFTQRNPTTQIPAVPDPGPHDCGTTHELGEPFWHDLRDAAAAGGWSVG